jgi:hypothetical protein
VTDYTKPTGSTGTMMIRDTGTKIEFWLKAGSATFNHQLPYGYTVNGTTDNSNEFNFVSGGAWQMLKSWTVSTSQTVTFRLQDTGTAGLGGPTTLSATISRAKVPSAPSTPTASAITSTGVVIAFSDGASNGSAIDYRQIGYGTSTTVQQTIIGSDGNTPFSGLHPGTTYYFWARTRNGVGYSPWSPRKTVVTLDEPGTSGILVLTDVDQTSVVGSFLDGPENGSVTLQRQIGYGTDPITPTSTADTSGNGRAREIDGLLPGTLYYFRTRTRNSVGWSPWSTAISATTVAGAFVKVGAVWLPAIPYVRVGGVWKVARPWSSAVGVWKETV